MQANDPIQQAVEHAHDHHEEYLEGFKALLRIPSISTDPTYKGQVQRAADWIVAEMQRIGLHHCASMPSTGHPVVYGEWIEAGDDKPTVLIYAHYDVQPVDPLELWESPPFEPAIRDDRLYARGVIDDKCGVFVTLKAFESMLSTAGRLPLNVKLFFEGDEESGSLGMEAIVKQHRDRLHANLLVLSDGGSQPDRPMIITSIRGIIGAEVKVTGPKRDLHSGSFGGIVHNPAHLVAQIIAALHDNEGRVQIPGFYDAVRPLNDAERKAIAEIEPVLEPHLREEAGIAAWWGVPGYSLLERQTAQPTCDVNGLYGGYQGPGGKTIIPASAGFKVSLRLVADQDPHNILRKFIDFVNSFEPETLNIEVTHVPPAWPAQLLSDGPAVEAIQRAFEAVWGKRAILYRQGGSVPIIGMFQRELGMPITSLGYGTGDNGHAPNEYYELPYFARNIDTAIHFYHYLAQMLPSMHQG